MQDFQNQPIRVTAQAGDGRSVANLITGDRLKAAVATGGFIQDGNPTSVEGAKYDFRMSPQILKASFGTPINLEKLPEDQRAQVKVEPGEVVFVRTIERLVLPNNVIAVLSPKRKLSHQGIIVLGGFAIDPKYRGPLFVGLYNFSSTPFHLQAGRKLIAAMFYELTEPEIMEFPTPEPMGEHDEFPDELVTLIKNYKPLEIKWVSDAISDTQRRLDALSAEFHDDRSWKREFQEALESHNKQIERLIDGLREERDARKSDDAAIKSTLQGMGDTFTVFRSVWVIIALIVTAILSGFFGWLIPKMMEHPAAVAPVPSIRGTFETAPAPVTVPQVQSPPTPSPPSTQEKK
jgi:deoxycytidine triphosphate deaminase